jgi:RAD51-like protein 3
VKKYESWFAYNYLITMRLASLVPSIPADLVTALNTIGIRTESDLLFSATPREILNRLPPETASLEDLEGAIATVAELAAASGVSCFDLLALEPRAIDSQAPLITGNEDIDRMLSGLGRHTVIQLSGDKGSGKSVWTHEPTLDNVHILIVVIQILALNLAVNLLACQNGSKVAWIDTTGDFSVEALNEILSEKQVDMRSSVYLSISTLSKLASTILDRLQVSLAFDLETAQAVLDELFRSGSVGIHGIWRSEHKFIFSGVSFFACDRLYHPSFGTTPQRHLSTRTCHYDRLHASFTIPGTNFSDYRSCE